MKTARCLVLLALTVVSCATPKEINGHKVIGTRWVDGKVVYIVEGDKEALERGVAEANRAAAGVVFKPGS